jgi:hypothetical protein
MYAGMSTREVQHLTETSSPLYASASSLVATFLRVDIPLAIHSHTYNHTHTNTRTHTAADTAAHLAYVLYTDVDVLFTRDITLAELARASGKNRLPQVNTLLP